MLNLDWHCGVINKKETLWVTRVNDRVKVLPAKARCLNHPNYITTQCNGIPLASVFKCVVKTTLWNWISKCGFSFSMSGICNFGDDMVTANVYHMWEAPKWRHQDVRKQMANEVTWFCCQTHQNQYCVQSINGQFYAWVSHCYLHYWVWSDQSIYLGVRTSCIWIMMKIPKG